MGKENKKEQDHSSLAVAVDATALLLEWSDLKDRIEDVEHKLQSFADLVKGKNPLEREGETYGNDYIN